MASLDHAVRSQPNGKNAYAWIIWNEKILRKVIPSLIHVLRHTFNLWFFAILNFRSFQCTQIISNLSKYHIHTDAQWNMHKKPCVFCSAKLFQNRKKNSTIVIGKRVSSTWVEHITCKRMCVCMSVFLM